MAKKSTTDKATTRKSTTKGGTRLAEKEARLLKDLESRARDVKGGARPRRPY